MEKTEIEDKVIVIIGERLELDPDRISAADNILEDLGADSLDIVELVMDLEEAFHIEIPDDEWDGSREKGMKSVEDVINYIVRRMS